MATNPESMAPMVNMLMAPEVISHSTAPEVIETPTPAPMYSFGAVSEAPLQGPIITEKVSSSTRRSYKGWIILAVVVAIAVALGVGLGVGLTTKNKSGSTLSEANQSSSIVASTSAAGSSSNSLASTLVTTTTTTSSASEYSSQYYISSAPSKAVSSTAVSSYTSTEFVSVSAVSSNAISVTAGSSTSLASFTVSTVDAATSTIPAANTATSIADVICIPESNVVQSPHFDDISAWNLTNAIYHFEQDLWTDSSSAGVFAPYEPYGNSYSAASTLYQNISGLDPDTEYYINFAFTVQKNAVTEDIYACATLLTYCGIEEFNMTLTAAQDPEFTTGYGEDFPGSEFGLKNWATGKSVTFTYTDIALNSSADGNIYIKLVSCSHTSYLYFHYMTIYNSSDDSCSGKNTSPDFVSSEIQVTYFDYDRDNGTVSDSYCSPDTNNLCDYFFTTISPNNTSTCWRMDNSTTTYFNITEFTDDSEAGVMLPYYPNYDGTLAAPASLLQETYLTTDIEYRIMMAYTLGQRNTTLDSDPGFLFTYIVATDEYFDNVIYLYNETQTFGDGSISTFTGTFFLPAGAINSYVKLEARSYMFDIYVVFATLYDNSDLSCNGLYPANPTSLFKVTSYTW
ncbi:uncharacterized protein V1518DRAFT_404432 [Limtongia smithiae]|uniref:uncharacterized protein n=1 Tax=Limtongia smithiae TaxID=1125753 RepID=UPI0034CD6652